jgi:hypothetical protein
MCGSSISRHESGERLPVLRTALMYEFILNTYVRELYESVFRDVRGAVRARAKGLCASLARKPQNPKRDHTIAVLRALLDEIPAVTSYAT